MTHRYIKIGATVVVLAGAFGFMMWSTLRDGAEYYKHVDEFVAEQQALQGKQLRLEGYVVPGSILNRPNTMEYRFKIQNNPIRSGDPGSVVEISYSGTVPDTFKSEAQVVLPGKLTADGFHPNPNGMIAKCPSKYEAAGSAPSGRAGGVGSAGS
jgi:cytochrome c-type biogenesis protein CcmE